MADGTLYAEYLKHGRKVSAAMLKEAQDYWDRNDRLKNFVKKYMQVREGALGVTLETASRSYRDYLVRILSTQARGYQR